MTISRFPLRNNVESRVKSHIFLESRILGSKKAKSRVLKILLEPLTKFDNENKMMKQLEGKSFVKYLAGVMIDNNLSWTFHVDYIALKTPQDSDML